MQKTLIRLNVIVWLIALISFSGQVHAQGTSSGKVTIEGSVIDNNNNEPIIGATVRLKSGTKGTVTNAEGKFTIAGCSPHDVFQVTYIGFKPKEFTVGKKHHFTVYLEENSTQLDQVVITGFQELKKNSFTGNATIVTKEDLQKANTKDAVKALQVFDPSFRILDNLGFGADPNQMHEINIRGASSISQERGLDVENQRLTQRTNLRDNPNMPIFMLDGFEVDVQKIYDMDINRIQSMTILKDAAATALYGSRAANGVIVVTTVPPKAGEIRIDYNTTMELTFPDLSDYNLTDAAEKLQVEKDAGYYSGGNFDGIEKAMLYNQRMNEVRRGVNTDWLARPLHNAYNWRNDISLSGGVESVRYMLNLNYDNNSGVMKGSKRNRYGAGMTVDYRLKNWLQIQNKVSLDRTNYQDSPYGYFNDYSNQLPYDAIYDERGEYLKILPMSHRSNPLWQEQNLQSYFGRGGITDITDNFLINIHFTQNFYLRGTFSVSQVKTDSKTFRDPKDESFRTLANNRKGSLSTSGDTRLKWNANALLHFNQRFGKHFVNLTGGIDAQETKDNRVSYVQEGFNIGSLSDPIYAAQQPDKTVDTKSTTRLFGFLSSLNYTFDEVYLLDASFRLDGSSQFGKDKRFAPFASIGLGLNIHNYKFMKELPWINTLRVRGTYGSTGKVNFSRFDVISSYIVDSNSWYYTGPAVKLYTMGNPRLTWETTKTLDFGLMAEFFKNRLYLEANYYRKTTDGMIDKIAIRPSSGFTSYNGNVGSIINRGFELKTNVTLFRNKDWSVVANANLASNKNKISKLDEAIEEYNKKIRENYDAENPQYANLQNRPLIQYYVGASTTSIYAVPSLGIDPASGKEMFLKKDGTITKEWNANDMVVCGNTSPDAQGSFGFNVAYKGLYVNASFLYAFGGQQYNQTLLDKVENANIENGNVDRRVLTDRWRKVGDVSPFYGLIERGSTKPTSRFVQNENYVYFNSIAIGYDFGRKFVSMLKLSALSVSFNASDLARWSTIKQERGLSYPYAHTYSISLRASY
ncbi:MAG: SusC/RagA family TonB-linked outer membrane protein [Prevotella sp.]|nr:SusC/RagA family TonB-linked outer membrane protein [Prevotella sp.]MDY4038826.1 SusC/RagA family TonB-linked outer membrane protein [Prevotella sp.]